VTDDGQGARTGVRAGIVATGSELLTGRITDRNGPWVAERLGELGVEVSHLLLVGAVADEQQIGRASCRERV